MNQLTFFAVLGLATLHATAQSTTSDDGPCDTIQISNSDRQVVLSPRNVVTTKGDYTSIYQERPVANFTIDENGILTREGPECGFMPFLACPPSLVSVDTGFSILSDSRLAFDADTTFWVCHADVLLSEYPDISVDVGEVILNTIGGEYFAETQPERCERISFNAKKVCGGDDASDASDEEDGDVAATTTAAGSGSLQSSTPSTASSSSSSSVSPTSTTSPGAAVEESADGGGCRTERSSMALLCLAFAVGTGMWQL